VPAGLGAIFAERSDSKKRDKGQVRLKRLFEDSPYIAFHSDALIFFLSIISAFYHFLISYS